MTLRDAALIPPPHIPLSSLLSLTAGSKQDKGFICQVECVTQASALKQSTGNRERQRRRNAHRERERKKERRRCVELKGCSETRGRRGKLRCCFWLTHTCRTLTSPYVSSDRLISHLHTSNVFSIATHIYSLDINLLSND